jgi:hypothetical protein
MALGRQGDRQGDLVVTWREMPRSPGHVFYDRLQAVLIDGGFDAFAETTCKPYYPELCIGVGACSVIAWYRLGLGCSRRGLSIISCQVGHDESKGAQ